MIKKKIILPTKKFFKADEEDINIRVNLDETEALLRQGDKDIVLDIAQLFDDERNESNNYKIHGKLKMVFRNLYTGTTTYAPLKRNLYLNGDGTEALTTYPGSLPYNEFAFLRKDVLREVNIPQTGSTLTTFTQNIQLTGTTYTGHTTTTSIDAPYKNWNVYLSYAYAKNSDYPMAYTLTGGTTGLTYNFTAKDGIPFRVTDDGTYYVLTSPVEHGMSQGEYVTLSTTGNTFYSTIGTGTTTNVTGRTFYIDTVGNEVHNSEKYVISLLKTDFKNGSTLGTVVFGKRCIDKDNITGTTSEYYVHKLKTLTETNDYILDKLGFETPIWEEERKLVFETSEGDNDYLVELNRMESVLYDFKEPLNLTGVTNNLGYSPTEVFVSVIFRNGNGYFDYPPKVGYKFNFHNTWIDNHFVGTGSTETGIPSSTFTSNIGTTGFTRGNELPIGTVLTGDFIEYNRQELKERVVSPAFHKFNIKSTIFNHGQNTALTYAGQSPVGLYYQPYYKIKLRQLSPYIETSNTDDIYNLPENATYFEDEGLWKWRDVYDMGFTDIDGNGIDYPFINNIHYVKNDINFYLRNEEYYTNKEDGITSFNNRNNLNGTNLTDC
jgi:hypothetical protein